MHLASNSERRDQVAHLSKHHRQVERLATRLLRGQFTDARDLWQIQLDCLKLQRQIQADIAAIRKKPRRDQDALELSTLKDARWNARHFGNALAWVLLGQNKQFIVSLSNNAPVPISEPGHGSDGMIALAEGLSAKGWGFPFIHDITDVLRVGDVTFVRPEDSRVPYLTVEIKTRLLDKAADAEGGTSMTVQSKILTHAPIDPDTGQSLEESFNLAASKQPVADPSRRDQRQIVRMRDAILRATATDGPIKGLNEPTINLRLTLDTESHWKTVRRLIREARRDGVSTECVDDAFFYVAMYSEDPLTLDGLDNSGFLQNVLDSDFMKSIVPAERSITVNAVPQKKGRAAYTHLPYFLFNIPRRAVVDMLHGRLHLLVLVNQGHICDRLRDDGFRVELHPQRQGPGEIVIVERFEGEDGYMYDMESHQFPHVINETIHEFHSIDYLLAMVSGMVEAGRVHAPDLRQDGAGAF